MYDLPSGYRGTQLAMIDCSQEAQPGTYLEFRPTEIVQSPIGAYRQASSEPFSRFGYRFQIRHIGRPHMMVISYPDDRRRYMCVNDGTCYDLTTGVYTAVSHPLSHAMQRIENIFWPRWQDCSVLFMTWGQGEPAAVAGFAVYELDGLPKAAVAADWPSARRSFGIQYEDPCGKGASEGAMDFATWLNHHIDYAHHTGQNRLVYPICWYHGPQYPSKVQPADAFDVVIAEDRSMYSRATTHPADWLAELLQRFETEQLEFVGSMTLLRLGNLLAGMNIDLDSIRQGRETYNNMLWNNQVQSSCGDWTTVYNARNYREYVTWQEEGRDMANFPWQYGERRGDFHGGPMFNPLHPEVQRQILATIDEIGARYGHYRSFKGLAINMWHATILWFGSIHSGYDDYTAACFEAETGIRTGVAPDDPERFAKRYQYLTFKCRPAWLEWRCRKIADLVGRIRDTLRRHNPALTLTLTFWNETSVAQVLGMPGPGTNLHARPNGFDFYREAGADLDLLGQLDGVAVVVENNHQRDRGWDAQGCLAPLERGFMFHDHDFLDSSVHRSLDQARTPGSFIFNCWVEAWGEHKWFNCKPDDPNLDLVTPMYGEPAEYVFNMNSYYPDDGFWWDWQLRIISAFPPDRYYKERLVNAIAEYDSLDISSGGLYLDKANSRAIRELACAFRTLPRQKFGTVGGSTDPVAVRQLVADGRLYFYLVNREPAAIPVELAFTGEAGVIEDLGSGSRQPVGRKLAVTLAPYDLQVFAAAPDIAVESLTLPEDPLAGLADQLAIQDEAFDRVRAKDIMIPGLDRMEADMRLAASQRRSAWLRHALGGYICSKARSETGFSLFNDQ